MLCPLWGFHYLYSHLFPQTKNAPVSIKRQRRFTSSAVPLLLLFKKQPPQNISPKGVNADSFNAESIRLNLHKLSLNSLIQLLLRRFLLCAAIIFHLPITFWKQTANLLTLSHCIFWYEQNYNLFFLKVKKKFYLCLFL